MVQISKMIQASKYEFSSGESDQKLCFSGRRVRPKNPGADRHEILWETCSQQWGRCPGRLKDNHDHDHYLAFAGQPLRSGTKTIVGFTFI